MRKVSKLYRIYTRKITFHPGMKYSVLHRTYMTSSSSDRQWEASPHSEVHSDISQENRSLTVQSIFSTTVKKAIQ